MAESTSLTRADIHRLFGLLDEELAHEGVQGEVYLVSVARLVRLAVFGAGVQ
jgi:hypothetical protein